MFRQTLPENLTIKPDRARSFVKPRPRFQLQRRQVRTLPHFGAGSQCRTAATPPAATTPEEIPMGETIFAKIIAGQIPCHKVYEDDRVLAFLDINPLTPGIRS